MRIDHPPVPTPEQISQFNTAILELESFGRNAGITIFTESEDAADFLISLGRLQEIYAGLKRRFDEARMRERKQ